MLLLNDDYTPMEFVVHVLERFFNKDREAATGIMLHVHHHGIGECGVYTYEVAETKVTQVMDFARQHQHPLQCAMEKKESPVPPFSRTLDRENARQFKQTRARPRLANERHHEYRHARAPAAGADRRPGRRAR